MSHPVFRVQGAGFGLSRSRRRQEAAIPRPWPIGGALSGLAAVWINPWLIGSVEEGSFTWANRSVNPGFRKLAKDPSLGI